jgi:hypothetical protein
MDEISEHNFKELSRKDRSWVMYSMIQTIQRRLVEGDGRIKKLENKRFVDSGISAAAGGAGGFVAMILFWFKSSIVKLLSGG